MRFFTLEKINRLLNDVRAAVQAESIAIPRFKWLEGDPGGAAAPDFDDSAWADFAIPGYWGGYDVIAWFRAAVEIPPAWAGQKLALRFLAGPRDGYGSTAEVLLHVNGRALQGIDIWHEEAVLPAEACQEGRLQVALRAWSGVLRIPPRRHFKLAQLVRIDPAAERFYHLAHTVAMALPLLDANDLRRVRLEEALNAAFLRIDFVRAGRPEFYASLAAALADLEERLAGLRRDELKPTVTAVGHSHIDLAWLWQLARTREKAVRTFSTVLNLMRQYPEYHYSHSSPQLYDFVRQDAPELYAQVQARAREQRWEVLGGSWVEMDTLIPSGEALVRQVLLGKRFTRREFGADPRVLWLPDSFGFSAQLPAILRGAGIEGFMTAVVSYSRFTRFPYDTFRWRGPDGSQVLVSFITTPAEASQHYNYIGRLEPADTLQTWNNNRQKQFQDEVLLPFGWGDGGGGPTAAMLEQARAMANLPGLPYVRTGRVEDFFARLQARTAGLDLPVVDGEIYLENLRGSYTSQARNKRANRKSEVLYHDAEWLCALADLLGGEQRYPQAQLARGWQRLLLNQFHDILSGTSITPVHADALRDYAEIEAIGQAALAGARGQVAAGLNTAGPGLLVFNPTAWQRSELVALPWREEFAGRAFRGPEGAPLASQRTEGGQTLLVRAEEVPPLGYCFYPLDDAPAAPAPNRLIASPTHLESPLYRIELNANGQIATLRLRPSGREALADGEPCNQLQAFEDRSIDGEAWQIEPYYQEKLLPVSDLREAVVEEAGPLRASLRLVWRFDRSTITQRLRIYDGCPRIDFETVLDWQQHQVLLKAAFPLRVRARSATYDLGFASLERPTHWNTPFDAAHFENPAHKWVDLSEPGAGAALLNDCKYGYDVKDHTLRLSLHRSPTDPDPQADQGEHRFTYSLLPHDGDWRAAGVVGAAYALNDPLQAAYLPAAQTGALPERFSLARALQDGVVIETVKRAEDGDAWILRLYESHGRRHAAARLEFGLPLRQAAACNLLEEVTAPLDFSTDTMAFPLGPFEIRTFKLWFE